MFLSYGKMNLFGHSTFYTGALAGWNTPTATTSSSITAPDGEDFGMGWEAPNGTDYIESDTTAYFNPDSLVTISGYIQPKTSDNLNINVTLSDGAASFGVVFNFVDGSYNAAALSGSGVVDYSMDLVTYSGWYRFCVIINTRVSGTSGNYHYVRIMPNYTNVLGPALGGFYIWGLQLQETDKYTNYTGLVQTIGSVVNNGDFYSFKFSQEPSSITENGRDLSKLDTYANGSSAYVSKYLDSNVYEMSWSKINYLKHGKMLYDLANSVSNNLDGTCKLVYPPLFFREIKSADIRCLGFTYSYLGLPGYVTAKLTYTVLNHFKY